MFFNIIKFTTYICFQVCFFLIIYALTILKEARSEIFGACNSIDIKKKREKKWTRMMSKPNKSVADQIEAS